MAQSEYDLLATGLGYEEYHHQVGAYQCARRAVDLVDTLIAKVEDHDRLARPDTSARDHQRAITYGSHLWRP